MRLVGVVVCAAACGRVGFDVRAVDDSGTGGGSDTSVDVGPTTYREYVLADQPIAYWRLASAGVDITDERGTFPGVAQGTCNSVPGLISGDPDGAILFDGATCAIDLGDTFLFPGTASWTVEAWVRWSGVLITGNYQHIFTRQLRSGGPDDGYALIFQESGPAGVTVERVVSRTALALAPQPFPGGEIIHLVAVYDGAGVTLFRNTVFMTAVLDSRSMPAFTAKAWIGWAPDPADMLINFFSGVIDEVAVYDRALTPAEIIVHHNVGTTGVP